jgi:hypothetical protein
VPDSNFTDVTILLDRSGSMANLAADLRGGINSLLDEQAGLPGKILVSIVQFDNEILETCLGVSAAAAPRLDESNYVPRASTALNDAMGITITRTGERYSALTEENRPGKVVFVVFTDGMENSSIEYSSERILEMVKHQTDTYGWKFLFLGANIDAIAVGGQVGVENNYAATYSASPRAMRAATAMVSDKMRRFRISPTDTMPSWTQTERDDLKDS